MMWMHSDLGEVQGIPRWSQPGKTWKHMHSPVERWDAIVGTDVAALRSAAERAGSPLWTDREPAPPLPVIVQAVLRSHHDQWWETAYGNELLDASTQAARSRGGDRWKLCSPRGVFLALESTRRGWRVVSAFRPHPFGGGVGWTDEEFANHARDYWERDTGMSSTLFQSLKAATSRSIDTPAQAWRLAILIGRASWSNDPVIATELPIAREVLIRARADVLATLTPDGDAGIDALEASIRAEDSEDATRALLGMEDAFAVAGALNMGAIAQVWAEEIARIVEWAPESWTTLLPLAFARAGETGGFAREMWQAVEEACASVFARTGSPTQRPTPSLTASVLPPPPWANLATKLVSTGLDALQGRLRFANDAAAVAPRLALGTAVSGPWRVTPKTATRRMPNARAFAVDGANPDGVCVDDQLRDAAARVWELDSPGDSALLVFLHGPTPIVGVTLQSVLAFAATNPEVVVTVAVVSRPA